jgi:hypothetical protein
MRTSFGLYHALGALTPDQVAHTDRVLADLWTRIGQQNSIVRKAREAGFDRALVSDLTERGNALMEQVKAMSVQRDGISNQQYDEWRNRLQALGTEVDLYEQAVRTQLGTGASVRNWRIIGATAGALALAGVLGFGVWYWSRR